ncbi:hypothetical protein RA307_09995 [Xanthobacteraceae bacterium Astr-EGSB]|jgi:hypothetical protein|uniref:hypothetical protein n=1 Tax=Astrobacterium formosum TaxID=3069710 RepID=UPI0027AE8E8A|nr:hypothetical protein [Xanthobacteraceae bacterium Astr-EGSB]
MALHIAPTLCLDVYSTPAAGRRVLIARSFKLPDDPRAWFAAMTEVGNGFTVELRLLGADDGGGPFVAFDHRSAAGRA